VTETHVREGGLERTPQSTLALLIEVHDTSIDDGAGRNDKEDASTTMFSLCASANMTGEINV
jgi:hypothetical protein